MKKIDWFQIITDLQRNKIPMSKLSQKLGVSERTIANWKRITEPKYSEGVQIINLWRQIPNKTELPMKGHSNDRN